MEELKDIDYWEVAFVVSLVGAANQGNDPERALERAEKIADGALKRIRRKRLHLREESEES